MYITLIRSQFIKNTVDLIHTKGELNIRGPHNCT